MSTLLLSLRLAPVLVMTPVLSSMKLPASVKVLVVLGLSAMLVLGLPASALVSFGVDWPRLILAAISELLLGAALGFGLLCAFSSFSFGARIIDAQAGFGVSQLFDPATRTQMPVLTSAFSLLAVLLFFVMDIHHTMMRGLYLVVERIPPGAAFDVSAAAPMVITQAGALFALGFALVAPVVFWLLLVELGLSVLSRALPQMNILLLGMPVRIAAAMLGLALWLKYSSDVMAKVFITLLEGWSWLI
ncbi:MAG: hypothetical protein RIR70_687 [Pseudomonadota bacterium]